MTITDMMLKIAVRLSAMDAVPVESALDAINESVRYLALMLADRNSDLAATSFSIATTAQTASLPASFNGFVSKPVINNISLEPLPIDTTGIPLTAAQPLYYDVSDTTLYLYPTPLSSVTITGKYWSLPVDLTSSSAIPYGGKFDSLLLNMAVKIAISGLSVLSQQAFAVETRQGLDAVLFPRRPALPARRPFNSF